MALGSREQAAQPEGIGLECQPCHELKLVNGRVILIPIPFSSVLNPGLSRAQFIKCGWRKKAFMLRHVLQKLKYLFTTGKVRMALRVSYFPVAPSELSLLKALRSARAHCLIRSSSAPVSFAC